MAKRLLYHLTHIDNLSSILLMNELLSYSNMTELKSAYKDLADQRIQSQRALTAVPIHPYEHLHDYVPFYFAGRSPMLYRLQHNGISQQDLVYIMTNTHAIHSSGLEFVFTDGHAIMFLTKYFNSLSSIDKIDPEIMNSKYWMDTEEYPDRKRKRQAEFLIHKRVPLKYITGFAVYNEHTKGRVEELLQTAKLDKPVRTVRDFYF